MAWLPARKALVVKVATPPARVPVPRVVAPSLKVTVPEGVPAPGAGTLTVAVKVTELPWLAGLAPEARAVEVEAWPTVRLRVPPEPTKLTSPG